MPEKDLDKIKKEAERKLEERRKKALDEIRKVGK